MNDYIDWLKDRIEHAIASGEHWMLDGLDIARSWAERETGDILE